jgi:hypothetical protein
MCGLQFIVTNINTASKMSYVQYSVLFIFYSKYFMLTTPFFTNYIPTTYGGFILYRVMIFAGQRPITIFELSSKV